MKKINNKNFVYILYLAVLAFYLWMAAQIPYTHDDWDWGLEIGMQQLLYGTVNSRYVGNFFEVIMTRSELLKTIIMGVVYFAIPYLLTSIVKIEWHVEEPEKQVQLFVLCNLFLLIMNRTMWREVYGWVAGFANFAISAIFLMIWIVELFRAFDMENDHGRSVIRLICYFVICLCGQLFLENIAIYSVLTGIALNIFYYFRYRKVPGRIIAMLLGAMAGLVIMFSSNLYITLFETGYAVDGYRIIPALGDYGIREIIRSFFAQCGRLGTSLYFNNIVLSVSVLTMLGLLLSGRKCTILHQNCRKYCALNVLLIAAFLCCHLYDRKFTDHSSLMAWIDFLIAAGYFLTVVLELWVLFPGEKGKKLIVIWASAPMVIMPLLVTTEHGQRLFFTSNIFVILLALLLFAQIQNTVGERKWKKCGWGLLCAAVVIFVFRGSIYKDIGACKRLREEIICDSVRSNKAEIVLPAFPHSEYLHFPNPNRENRVEYFKEFYKIPDTVELIFE